MPFKNSEDARQAALKRHADAAANGTTKKARREKRKSGDSLLQDGEAARETERLEGANWSPKDQVESLAEEIQDQAELKKSVSAPPDLLAQTVQAMAMAMQALSSQVQTLQASRPQQRLDPLMKCPTCRQTVRNLATNRGVCVGTHVAVMIAPTQMSKWRDFPGISWNGVQYAGMQLVPPFMKNDLLSQVQRWAYMDDKRLNDSGSVFGDLDVKKSAIGRTPVINVQQ